MIQDKANSSFESIQHTESTNLNIFRIIQQLYGETIFHKCRTLEKTRLKYARYTNHLRISLRCHHNNMIPNDLFLKSKLKTPKSKQILERASHHQLLQERIHINQNRTNCIKTSLDKQTNHIQSILQPEHYNQLVTYHNNTYENETKKVKNCYLKKFNNLLKKQQHQQPPTENTIDKSKWIVNLPSKTLTPAEENLLQNGLNYSITPQTIPAADIIAKVETAIRTLPDREEVENIRAKTSLILQKAKLPKKNLPAEQKKALHSLREDNSIIILPADKGRSTVILNKQDYINKCQDHLNNDPYTKIQNDPTESVKKEARQKLSLLKDAGKIDQQLYFKLKPTDSQAPRFYGLPKIHKPAVPIRPIVSYTNSPLYQLSRYIADILRPYTKLNQQHCKNSNNFLQFIRQQIIDPDEIMISFDVESLYTNIPITDALLVIKDLLNNDTTLQDRTNLLPDQISELLEFLLCTTFFFFNGEFHQQTDGVAMGEPASSIVAKIYMISIETTVITTADTPPRIWECHVDDVFSILRRCNLEQFFQHINSLHPKTKFTMDREENSTIPFLDTLI